MSLAVLAKVQSSDEGDVQRVSAGDDVELMALDVMIYCVRKVRRKGEKFTKEIA